MKQFLKTSVHAAMVCGFMLGLATGARAATIVVSNTQDIGLGSLRAAIDTANAAPDSTIAFNIPTFDTGFANNVWTIRPLSSLPVLTGNGTIIDGASQSTFAGDTNPFGPEIVLDGAKTQSVGTTRGLDITASHCRINQLAVGNFPYAGIHIRGASTDNTVSNCYLGTDATGETFAPNSWGVLIGDGAHNNTIGGASGRNLLSGNTRAGAYITDAESNDNAVLNNVIGLNRDGTRALANGAAGVQILAGAKRCLVDGNFIAGNGNSGVIISASAANVVTNNVIGLAFDGQTSIPNVFGVACIGGASSNVIGGSTLSARNVIAGNENINVFVSGSGTNDNKIVGNRIGVNASGTAAIAVNDSIDPNAPSGYVGIEVVGGALNTIIGGAAAGEGNQIGGALQAGINVLDAATRNTTIAGNLIGTDASGLTVLPNFVGIVIARGAKANTIGGNTSAAGNLISGNRQHGVLISDAGSDDNAVLANRIGTTMNGNAPLPNLYGISIMKGAKENIIGAAGGAGNVVSGNIVDGINIDGIGTDRNRVQNNLIGTNSDGTLAVANNRNGVSVEGGARDNVIGGQETSVRNIISGNGRSGVSVTGIVNGTIVLATQSTLIQGNFIGTNKSGTATLGNGTSGVGLGDGAQRTLIGGSAAGASNVISGNREQGVSIGRPNAILNNVHSNFIGTDVTGTKPIPNGAGVRLTSGASRNGIGGFGAAGNRIAFNSKWGVVVTQATSKGNKISGNAIYENGFVGIDLLAPGEVEGTVTINDVDDRDDGPNALQNFPVVTAARQNGNTLALSGELVSVPNTRFQIEVFANRKADASGFGEGERIITQAIASSDATGKLRFGFNLSGNFLGQFISATAINTATGDTSEFSQAIAVKTALTISSFSPLKGTPGTVVTITGTNLNTVRRVGFGGQDATFTILSPTMLRAVVPFAARTGRIAVLSAEETATSATDFVVTATSLAPVITRISPLSGPVGTIISIEGRNLAQTGAVFLSGIEAPIVSRRDTLVRVRVGIGTIDSLVFLSTPAGTVVSRESFHVTKSATAPIISDFSPHRITVGTVVTITGRNFLPSPVVRFNAAIARVLSATATQIRVVVPEGYFAASAQRFSVTTAAGTGVSATPFESVGGDQIGVALREITPARAAVGAKVLLRGLNLAAATSVKFNGVEASVEVISSDEIRATVPASARSGRITIATPRGELSSAGIFLVLQMPTIAGISPNHSAPGSSVTIDGSGFTGATGVKFGATNVTNFVLVSDTRIVATIPNLPRGSTPVVASTPVGNSAAKAFTVEIGAPTITKFTPDRGRPGTQVLITGRNLSGASVMFTGGAASSVTFLGDGSTQLLATAPANVQTGRITITTLGGAVSTTSNFSRIAICVRGICTQSFENDPKPGTRAAQVLSPVGLSSARATTVGALSLMFSGALGEVSIENFKAVIGGREVEIESAARDASAQRVTLQLRRSTLNAGTPVGITWRGLHDARNRVLATGGTTVLAR